MYNCMYMYVDKSQNLDSKAESQLTGMICMSIDILYVGRLMYLIVFRTSFYDGATAARTTCIKFKCVFSLPVALIVVFTMV